MMSCTLHSPMDSLAQPTCILVYIECNPAPGGSPFKLSLGLRSNSRVLFLPSPQSLLVWWFILGLPWVASMSLHARSCHFRAPTAGSHSPPNPSSPHLVQLQLWTPEITKTRPLSSVTPVSSVNNRSIPPFNPRGGPSKIPQLTCHPLHSTKSHPPLMTCTQAIPTTHGPLVLKATLLSHVAHLSNTRRRPTTVSWLHPLTVSPNGLADNHFQNRPLDWHICLIRKWRISCSHSLSLSALFVTVLHRTSRYFCCNSQQKRLELWLCIQGTRISATPATNGQMVSLGAEQGQQPIFLDPTMTTCRRTSHF